MRHATIIVAILAVVPLAGATAQVLEPSEFCSDHPDAAIATFEDAELEAEIRAALRESVGAQKDLTCGVISGLTQLDASRGGITSLVGIQNLTGLTILELDDNPWISDLSALSGLTSLKRLGLSGNSISDISALSGLTSLTFLSLATNSITDISALSGLTSLSSLYLNSNVNLSNIQPLLDNTGLGTGDRVFLRGANVGCADVAALEAKGVTVDSNCP